jgi:hypothetical protein
MKFSIFSYVTVDIQPHFTPNLNEKTISFPKSKLFDA